MTFWDTASGYNAGASAEVVGRVALEEFTRWDDIVVATAMFFPVDDGSLVRVLSRKALLVQLDDWLTGLGAGFVGF